MKRSASKPRTRLALVALLGLLTITSLILVASHGPLSASAAERQSIVRSFSRTRTWHRTNYVPDDTGKLVASEEFWTKNVKFLDLVRQPPGNNLATGYDGHLEFTYSDENAGYVDDNYVQPQADDLPELIGQSWLKWMKSTRAIEPGGRLLNLYASNSGRVQYELFSDPQTSLPVEFDKKSPDGEVLEVRKYEFPAQMSDGLFAVPSKRKPPLLNYPAMRSKLSEWLQVHPAQSQSVAGHAISLKGAVQWENSTLVIWTGGNRPEPSPKAGSILGCEILKSTEFHLAELVRGLSRTLKNRYGVPPNNLCFLSSGNSKLTLPFILNLGIWSADPNAPARLKKQLVIGQAQFTIRDAFRADQCWAELQKKTVAVQ